MSKDMQQVKLPAVWAIDSEVAGAGRVRQLLTPERTTSGRPVRYTHEKDSGWLIADEAGVALAYVFAKPPGLAKFQSSDKVLLSTLPNTAAAVIDLTDGSWLQQVRKNQVLKDVQSAAESARRSWREAFRFVEEDANRALVGLRNPQIGALHAIHAHWSVSNGLATIVMPTGTGKTETMLATLISAACERVLVVVPTDALRTQIAGKFETLGMLKTPGSALLADTAQLPVVGTLTTRPKSIEQVDAFMNLCNVVVTTSALLAGCNKNVRDRIASLASHLFIDEAHHAEAPSWKEFRTLFEKKRVLQFTATPFREDGEKIDGEFVYVYPLRMAQEAGYFKPIRFREVQEFDLQRGDRRIAEAAVHELDADSTGKHIVMARVGTINRAQAVSAIYRKIGRYEAVVLHSRLPRREREEAKRRLLCGNARIVICVDMLGEGFDLPELKIAAFHDIRKSLAVTLQLAGRFTRTRSDLGEAVFIANTALVDVDEEIRALYARDPDWNDLLPRLSSNAIDEEVGAQKFFKGFNTSISEIPLKTLRPAASMVVYRTRCSKWHPLQYRKGFRGLTSRDRVFHTINEAENVLIVLAATERGVKWSDVETVRELGWELFVAVWDKPNSLLYLHGSSIDGSYRDFAKAVCGADVELMVAPNLFRCFHRVKRLVLNNVGLNEHLGRQVQYTGRMGSDVEARIGQAVRQGSTKAVLAGQGFEAGCRVSIGAAKRGRVWSHSRLSVDTFGAWAKGIGRKLADQTIDPEGVLAGTLKPTAIDAYPSAIAIAAEWPIELQSKQGEAVTFRLKGLEDESLVNVDLEVCVRAGNDPLVIRVFCESWERLLCLELLGTEGGPDFRFSQKEGSTLEICTGRTRTTLANYFTEYPPTIWFADGSSLEGCQYVQLPASGLAPFPRERLEVMDWSGVDIRRESQGERREEGTIQRSVIKSLLNDQEYDVIFDDDGPGESADVVAIRNDSQGDRTVLRVDFYHCKYSTESPGARVDDLYVVCGQAQRSVSWLANRDRQTNLFTHLLRRDAKRIARGRSTRFEKGDVETLSRLREISRRSAVALTVTVVQPGLSASQASNHQLALLAVTERFLTDTYEVPLRIWCSA